MSSGLAREEEILDALAQELGMEKVSLRDVIVTPASLEMVDPDFARQHHVFPVKYTKDALYVAVSDPLHFEIIDDLERITGKEVVALLAPESEILEAIRRYYGAVPQSPRVEKVAAETVEQKELEQLGQTATQPDDVLQKVRESWATERRAATPFRSQQEYVLAIRPEGAEVAATGSTGLFYGVQTMTQLVRQYGRRLPALRIVDQPDFRWRGFMLDVSRGRVPKLDTLKWLVHTLSHFKINMLQLYVEHTFHFRSHPEIGEGCSPLEPEEIAELDRYCRSRHVELVPSLQSFGHMGYILSLPKFRHLAEIVQFKSWKRATWRKRMRGMTIAPVDEETYRFLGELYADFLPNFSSQWFNLNSDETWDVGKGRSRELAAEIGVGQLYLRHVERIAELARRHGRRPMIWSDIIYQHPELIGNVPRDIILLDWGYSHDSPFDRCERLAELKRPFFVCPGTSGWNQVFNDVWNATLNIRRFVAAGKRYGALGVLNTDWGDCGHFNMLGGSLHGAVLGAAMSWNEGRPDDETFDRAFSLHAFDDPKGIMGRAIRRAGSLVREKTGKDIKTWDLWASPLQDGLAGREIPKTATKPLSEALYELTEALALCPRAVRERDSWSWSEISLGVAMLGDLVIRAELDHKRLGLASGRRKEYITYADLADHAAVHARWFKTLWDVRNKPSNLADILRVFERQIRDARAVGGK